MYTPKRKDEHPYHFHMRSPSPPPPLTTDCISETLLPRGTSDCPERELEK